MITLGGKIQGLAVSHLFVGLRAQKKTGTAVFKSADIVKKVFFRDGDVMFASSNVIDDRLGEYLLNAGAITRDQYDASVAMIKQTGKKQGAILVELGFLTMRGLVEAVKEQVTQIIMSLFSWRDGTYQFDEGPLLRDDIIPLRMSSGNLILSGVRRLDWGIVQGSLPAPETVLRPATDPAALFQTAELSENQKAVLTLIDGKRTMKDVCSLSKAGDFYTLKVIHLFLSLRMAEIGEISDEEERAFVQEVVKEAVAKQEDPVSSEASEMKARFQKAYEELAAQDNHQVLGVSKNASPQDIQTAYLRLAKQYHPDRHFEAGMEEMKETLEKLFGRITEAYNALNERALRSEYTYLMNQGQVKTAKRAAHVESGAAGDGPQGIHFRDGLKEYEKGNYWMALESFRKASELDPKNAVYVYYQGLSLMQMPRKHYEAEENFKKAIKLEPSKAEFYFDLGTLYLNRGLKKRALSVFMDALQRDPNSEKIKEAIRAAGGR